MRQPPIWMTRLLKGYFREDLWESIEGDLYELHQDEVSRLGTTTANRRYLFNALAFLRYHRLRQYSKTQNHMDLFKNYLKVSWRDISRHRVFSAINMLGLVLGFSILLLVLQYVLYETNYDRYHSQSAQIYRIINDRYQNGMMVQRGPITYPTIGPILAQDYPEVEKYTRMRDGGRNFLSRGDDSFLLDNYIWADGNFLEVFTHQVIAGNLATALDEPAAIVLTESYAERLLKPGEHIKDLMGAQVLINNWDFSCTISAIIEDVPAQSHLQFEALISYETFIRLAGEGADNSWQWSDFNHYVVLNGATDPNSFKAKLNEFSATYFKSGEISGAIEKFELQPLTNIHLNNTLEYEYANVTDPDFIKLMGIIAIIIMVIAWINYINLTTSRSMQRAREVGVRKVLGAHRKQLIGQFLTESMLFNGIAILFSLFMVALCQSQFNQLVRLPLDLFVLVKAELFGLPFPFLFIATIIVITALVGIYPAMLLARFKPKEVIKGRYQAVGEMVMLRKALVIIQFTAALILISGSIAIYRQIDFMLSQDLGLTIENNLVVFGPELEDFDSTYIGHFEEFKSSLLATPGIESVTSAGRMFGSTMARSFQLRNVNDPEKVDHTGNWMGVDYHFADQFHIPIIEGRFFAQADHNSDGRKINTIVINKAAADKIFGGAKEALNQKVAMGDNGRQYQVVGITENFHQRSLKQSIEPIILFPFYDNYHFIMIKYANGTEQQTIANAERLYNQFYPGNYFDYLFLDDHFDRQYDADQRIGNMAAILTTVAILLAILGLYGLVLITFMKKYKEIGVRKVLGASQAILLKLYGRQFIQLVLLSIAIGFPISFGLISNFMQGYAYATGVELWVIATASLIMIVLCACTVLLQVRKIATNNPVDSLRYE